MEIFASKYIPSAKDQTMEWVRGKTEEIEKELLTNPGGDNAVEFWRRGCVDVLGYRFQPVDDKHVLVTPTNEDGNEWMEYTVPSTDPELVHRYVLANCGNDCAYIILDESVKFYTT